MLHPSLGSFRYTPRPPFFNQGLSIDTVPAAAFTNGGGGVIGL